MTTSAMQGGAEPAIGDQLDRVTARDLMLTWPEEGWLQDFGALAILEGGSLLDSDGEFQIEGSARPSVADRISCHGFRQILYRPKRGLGWPV